MEKNRELLGMHCVKDSPKHDGVLQLNMLHVIMYTEHCIMYSDSILNKSPQFAYELTPIYELSASSQ